MDDSYYAHLFGYVRHQRVMFVLATENICQIILRYVVELTARVPFIYVDPIVAGQSPAKIVHSNVCDLHPHCDEGTTTFKYGAFFTNT